MRKIEKTIGDINRGREAGVPKRVLYQELSQVETNARQVAGSNGLGILDLIRRRVFGRVAEEIRNSGAGNNRG